MSNMALPHNGIASWTTEMNYLLERENNIDYIIGPSSDILIEKPKQIFIKKRSLSDKVFGKVDYSNRFNPYVRALNKVLLKEEKVILQVKDNFGLLRHILRYIHKNSLRKRVYVQYHYHSFLPFTLKEEIYNQLDELVLLTDTTYLKFKELCNVLSCKISINTDGVDSELFKTISKQEKIDLRNKFDLNQDKIIFTWCSQDRKKKGLDLIMEVWKLLYKKYGDQIQLNVIGLKRDIEFPGVQAIGRVPNKELSEYYQLSDFYLFPSLWQEGFGLSLLEALKCGCYCIASDNGAIKEVLNNGSYGKLISVPNSSKMWFEEINNAIEEFTKNNRINPFGKKIPADLFDVSYWFQRYNKNIEEAKESFELRNYI